MFTQAKADRAYLKEHRRKDFIFIRRLETFLGAVFLLALIPAIIEAVSR